MTEQIYNLKPSSIYDVTDKSFFIEKDMNYDYLPPNCFDYYEIYSEYADILHSCKNYYCLYSGGNIMTAGIKNTYSSQMNIHSFLHGSLKEHKDKNYFVFDNVNYIES